MIQTNQDMTDLLLIFAGIGTAMAWGYILGWLSARKMTKNEFERRIQRINRLGK